jgi:hypothetical protein
VHTCFTLRVIGWVFFRNLMAVWSLSFWFHYHVFFKSFQYVFGGLSPCLPSPVCMHVSFGRNASSFNEEQVPVFIFCIIGFNFPVFVLFYPRFFLAGRSFLFSKTLILRWREEKWYDLSASEASCYDGMNGKREKRKKEERTKKKQPKLISRSSGWHHTCKEGKRETENEGEIQIVLVY